MTKFVNILGSLYFGTKALVRPRNPQTKEGTSCAIRTYTVCRVEYHEYVLDMQCLRK
jgi:hypothetical protein